MQEKPSITIGPREITIAVVTLGVLGVMSVLFALGLSMLTANQPQPEAALTPPTVEGLAIVFPTASPAVPTATPDPFVALTVEPDQVEHVVQEGESPAVIAERYGIDLIALLEANNLTLDSVVQAEQVLVIPTPQGGLGVFHEVRFGESQTSIAELYGVNTDLILDANGITDPNSLIAGQRLRIPGVEGPALPPTPTLEPLPDNLDGPVLADWPRSTLVGDLAQNYPLTYTHPRFTVHYQPGTYADQFFGEALTLLDESLAHVEEMLGVTMDRPFDIYLAGTLFEYPNAHLRGLSTREGLLFILYDGSGDEADTAYLVTHELTHMVARSTWGAPTSTMLSEGLATYVGQAMLEEGGYLPYDQLCLAAYEAGELPSMAAIETDFRQFEGHIRHRYSYFGSACFVGWLAAEYDIERLARLYPTSNYVGIYGESLAQLNAAWLDALGSGDLETDPQALVDYTAEVRQAYAYVFSLYDGSPLMHRAYFAVDRARVALWRADYEDTRFWLDEVYALTGFEPDGFGTDP
ncbi:MAG: LysM peptidoglycan-binding domain-containing protein [Anaerolineae bacterium]